MPSIIRCLITLAFASILTACDGAPVKATMTSVSVPGDLTASIVPSAIVVPIAGQPCLAAAPGNFAFDIAITTTTGVDLNRVTLRLNDGSNVGGATITFPTTFLTQHFNTTVVPAGGTRVFTFNPPFGCSVLPSNIVFADIFLTDASGSSRMVTVSTPLS